MRVERVGEGRGGEGRGKSHDPIGWIYPFNSKIGSNIFTGIRPKQKF